jgi:DNA (cytosine-5)-methyltransferase 1
MMTTTNQITLSFPTIPLHSTGPETTKWRVLDLFAGGCGAGTGIHRIGGVEHALSVEWDAAAAATAVAAGFPARRADVRDATLYDDLAVDLVWASPPCQAWSQANQHEGLKGEDDVARNGWPWTVGLLERLRPRRAVMENVKGSRKYVEATVLPELRRLYPYVDLWQVNAKDYGVPQSRTRIFVVCSEVRLVKPVPTHGPGTTHPWITMRDAIGVAWDRPSPCVSATEWKGASSQTKWHKLNRASDALAIATGGARRRLTIPECARLQTFPEDYPWKGSSKEQYTQIGNAVPPALAEVIGRAVLLPTP